MLRIPPANEFTRIGKASLCSFSAKAGGVCLPCWYKSALLLICLSLFAPWPSYADTAEVSEGAQVVRKAIDDIRQVVVNGKGKISDEELDKQLENILIPIFDFAEMSRRCLGAHWKTGSPQQQDEFVELFSALLSRTYLGKVKNIDRNIVDFQGESTVEGKTVVRSVVKSQDGEEIRLDYRVRQTAGKWRVYDVIIENVGIISNYRHEFAEIIRKKQFSGLIADLKEKTESQKNIAANERN